LFFFARKHASIMEYKLFIFQRHIDWDHEWCHSCNRWRFVASRSVPKYTKFWQFKKAKSLILKNWGNFFNGHVMVRTMSTQDSTYMWILGTQKFHKFL
jgi:hypothetical protein